MLDMTGADCRFRHRLRINTLHPRLAKFCHCVHCCGSFKLDLFDLGVVCHAIDDLQLIAKSIIATIDTEELIFGRDFPPLRTPIYR